MIKISLVKLDNEGHSFSGNVPASLLKPFNDPLILDCDRIYYDIHASTVNEKLLIRGNVKTTLYVKCAKCLDKIKFDILNDDICHYYEKLSKMEINISGEIREDILIKIPQKIVCSENCKGICPQCGVNLNNKSCSCIEKQKTDNVWSELDKLKD